MSYLDILMSRGRQGTLFDQLAYRKMVGGGGGGTVIGTDTEPYLYRSSPSLGDYNRERDEIVGVSVGWNSLLDTSWLITQNGITPSMDSNGLITLSGTAAGTYSNIFGSRAIGIAGHRYLLIYRIVSNPNNLSIRADVNNANQKINSNGGSIFSVANPANTCGIGLGSLTANTDYTGVKLYMYITDITAMLGATIADYIYTLEQGTAGAGVSFFRKYFSADYYPYSSGEIRSVEGLVSHDTVGKNLFSGTAPRTIYPFAMAKETQITASLYKVSADGYAVLRVYDENKTQTNSYTLNSIDGDKRYRTITLSEDIFYVNFDTDSSTTEVENLQIEFGSTATAYEPYTKHSYPLDSTVTLRGLLKLEDGKLKADGDIYKADGSVNRKFGVVDLGSLSWGGNFTDGYGYASLSNPKRSGNADTCISSGMPSAITSYKINNNNDFLVVYFASGAYADGNALKTAMNGVMLVYELNEPTTETAQPYAKSQKVSPSGTEEYVTTSIVPVGHNTEYYG